MSRPGAWSRVLTNIGKYLRKDWSKKHYIGEDNVGNKFYEISNSRQNVSRGFERTDGRKDIQPSLEWQSWLRGTRRFPPSEQELALNAARQQAQLSDNTTTERNAPHLNESGGHREEKVAPFPKYDDLEVTPGFKPDKHEKK